MPLRMRLIGIKVAGKKRLKSAIFGPPFSQQSRIFLAVCRTKTIVTTFLVRWRILLCFHHEAVHLLGSFFILYNVTLKLPC